MMNDHLFGPFERRPIFHLVPTAYYHCQPPDRPYLPATFGEEGFIHCTADIDTLLQVANAFFAGLEGDLLALEIDPARLSAPLKYEPAMPPAQTGAPGQPAFTPEPDQLFPHVYGLLNRQAIVRIVALQRDPAGRWQISDATGTPG
jgi:uncharacterized protein (DUF952 family)